MSTSNIFPNGFVRLGFGLVLVSSIATIHAQQHHDSEHVLFQAVRHGDIALLKDILRRGTPPDVLSRDGSTPLMAAALHGDASMVELLLRHGADPNAANQQGATALIWGARDPGKVLLLLQSGADPQARTALGNTPLMVAAASPAGAPAVAQLLDRGVDIQLRNKSGRNSLWNAANGGSLESVLLLLNKARELKILEEFIRESGPVVAIAASNGFNEIVSVLLENGADPNQTNGSRGNALNAALLAGRTDIAKGLIERGMPLDQRIQPGDVPTAVLAAYTEVGDCSIVELARQRGIDFAAHSSENQTALTWARMRGAASLIERLQAAHTPEGELPSRPEIPSRSLDLNDGNRSGIIAEAVQKSVDLLQVSSDGFLEVRSNCVSCHHQNLPSVALAWARDRGFRVGKETLDRMIERQVKSWQPRIGRSYELDAPYPVPPRFLGYGLWGFAEMGYRPDELTRATTWYLAATQQPDGRWVPGMLRPPVGDGEILATILAMRSLQFYPLEGNEGETAERVERARSWLQQAEPRTHQERVYRMLGLAWAGTEADQLSQEVDRLLAAQRNDGGWAQLDGLASDAWATGQTLVALRVAGGLASTHPAYQAGIEMLLRTQFDDGSWFVQSRSWPFQPYFESQFPHGRDQWVSAPATAWAVMALVLAIQPHEIAQLDLTTTLAAREANSPAAARSTSLVPAADRPVDFPRDVMPLLARSCLGCHGVKEPEANFSLTSRAALIRGGDSELPAIVPGNSRDSQLIRFAAGLVTEMEMPPPDARDTFPPLSNHEIALLRAWVDQGATWPEGVRFDPSSGTAATK